MGGRQSALGGEEWQIRDPFPLITEINELIKQVIENELILNLVIEKLETSNTDFHNCRMVCSQWKRLATKCIQKRNWRTRKFFSFPSDMILRNYLKTISRGGLDDQFYCCYILDRMNRSCKYNEKLLNKFFETQTGRIKGLSLNFHYRSREEFEFILKSQSNSLIDLKVAINSVMEIENDFSAIKSIADGQNADDFKMVQLNTLCFALGFPTVLNSETQHQFSNPLIWLNLLELLLNRIPQGKLVKISFMNCVGITRTVELFQKYNQISNLKILVITSLQRGELRVLEDSGVKLQYLGVDPSPKYGEGNDEDNLNLTQEISGFLHTQSKTLEMLSWGSAWKFKFPSRMIALKKLRLSVEKVSFDSDSDYEDQELSDRQKSWQKSSLLYEYLFPRLEELEIRSAQHKDFIPPDEFISWFLHPQFACTPIKKFGIYYPGTNSKILRSISSTFAHITSLGIGLYKEFMPNIKGEMEFFKVLWNAEFAPNLQELTIKFSVTDRWTNKKRKKYELDSLFSGVDIPTIHQVSVSASSSYAGYQRVMESKYEYDQESGEGERSDGSILNYKNLKKLTINVSKHFCLSKGRFTDFSAFCLFARLEQLELLHLDPGIRVFSRAAVQHLQAKFRKTPLPSPPFVHAQDRIDRTFGTSFYSTQNSLWSLDRKPLNLLDSNNLDLVDFDTEESDDSESESDKSSESDTDSD